MKKCFKCGETKLEDDFYQRVGSSDGLRNDCKDCSAQRCHNNYLNNKQDLLKKSLVYQKNNPEIVNKNNRKWRSLNQQKDKEIHRIWRQNNKEAMAVYSKRWRIEKRYLHNAKEARRRAFLKKAIPLWADKEAILKYYCLAAEMTKITGNPFHVDHIVPLNSNKVCGFHVQYNLQVIPGTENISKGNRKWPNMA